MARKKVTKKSTARKKKKASDSDEEATADFVRNNKARRRSRLDDVSFDDGGGPIVRDSAAARASDRRRAVAARPPAGGRGVDRWAGQADSDEESHDGAARPPAKRARVGAPARRSPHFSSGGRDAADAIDVDDEPRGTPAAAPDFVSRLQALSALRDDGHLTDAEFAKAKQKLLDE